MNIENHMRAIPKTSRSFLVKVLVGVFLSFLLALPLHAKEFRIGVIQKPDSSIDRYAPLEAYLNRHGVQATLIGISTSSEAARMFMEGALDGLFCGAGVAGILTIKKLGFPLVRPVRTDGSSTYGTVVLAPKGSPQFTARGDYFQGKKVAFCTLASAGEFFFRSVPGAVEASSGMIRAGSHSQAVWILAEGRADAAVVKDRVWETLKNRYPELMPVGRTSAENPEATLIISRKADRGAVGMVTFALVALEKDQSPEAAAVRDGLDIQRYAPTSSASFGYTFDLLEKAGVGPDFRIPIE